MTEAKENPKTSLITSAAEYLRQVKFPSVGEQAVFWSIILAGAGFDLWSKSAVFSWLSGVEHNEYSVIDGFFKMVMRVNPGAAFSIASGQRMPLLIVSVIALFVVVGVFLLGNIRQKIMQVALALFTAGIIGNLYDRAFNDGLVRDFLDFYIGDHHWPAFNVADSMLCIAVGLMVILSLKAPQDSADSADDSKS